ncbi:hypothetical protein U1Q18_015880, partial [Sarracenia purpurea var. burkii]
GSASIVVLLLKIFNQQKFSQSTDKKTQATVHGYAEFWYNSGMLYLVDALPCSCFADKLCFGRLICSDDMLGRYALFGMFCSAGSWSLIVMSCAAICFAG